MAKKKESMIDGEGGDGLGSQTLLNQEAKMTQANPVGWFEIYVADMPRAKAFYEAVFQVALERLPAPEDGSGLEMWNFPMRPEAPGCAGALAKMPGKDPGDGGTILYFSCRDCAAEATRAAEHGGSVHLPKMSIGPYGFIALVRDSEGNLIGLHSMA
jgi:predicted enzyme related to lactoylglutathione lyase